MRFAVSGRAVSPLQEVKHSSYPQDFFPFTPPPFQGEGGNTTSGVGLRGPVLSVVSVAIHPRRSMCRYGLRLSRWRGLLPNGNVLPRKCRMNQTFFPFTPPTFSGEGGEHNFRGGAAGVRAFRGVRG